MKRVLAHQLCLVNWRGVFYERYLLDPQVTALEGTNGAGKTTVMIALYLVLMPELGRLRFTNLGEHSPMGGDRGIYGRLGDRARPAYTALDFRLPRGERIVAGVHLIAKTEPTVELKPFIITGLAPEVALQDVLLDRGEATDQVPELPRLRDLVARLGGQLKDYTLKDYFAALFEKGITPLRLASDEDRRKLNDMLRTSMVGGISKTLSGTGLREFLLREDTGLGATLTKMRSNLEACSRTRTLVEESQRLQEEIHSVYEAGRAMFAAAMQGAQERERETCRQFREAEDALVGAQTRARELETDLADREERLEGQREQLKRAVEEQETAGQRLELTRRAHQRAEELRRKRAELSGAEGVEKAAQEARDRATSARDRAHSERERTMREREQAALALDSFEKGYENLQRQAAEYRRVSELLRASGVPREEVETRLGELLEERTALTVRIVSAEGELESAERQRAEFERVAAWLGEPVEPQEAFAQARKLLASWREAQALAGQREALERSLEECQKRVGQQKRAEELAWSLDTRDPAAAHKSCQEELDVARVRRQRELEAAARAEQAQAACARRMQELESRRGQWVNVRHSADRLQSAWECSLAAPADLLELQSRLQARKDEVATQLASRQQRREELLEQARDLEQSGGRFSDELLRARDLVEGELLAGRFEDVEAEDSARLQALLGPLAEAIVVDDPESAARQLAEWPGRPETVWLVAPDLEVGEGLLLGRNAWVGGRLTRFPEQPVLGRRARQARIESLRGEADELLANLPTAELAGLEEGLKDVLGLLPESALLAEPDPVGELELVGADERRLAEEARKARQRAAEVPVDTLARRLADLATLLPLAYLLELEDQERAAQQLAVRLEEARAAARLWESSQEARAGLEEGLELLRRVPLAEDELAARRQLLEQERGERARLLEAIESLRYLQEHAYAWEWEHAEATLQGQRSVGEAVRQALDLARQAAEAAAQVAFEAERDWTAAFSAWQQAEGKRGALAASVELAQEEWERLECPDCDEAAVRRCEGALKACIQRKEQLLGEERDQSEEVVRVRERLSVAGDEVVRRETELGQARTPWESARDTWDGLKVQADRHGLLAEGLAVVFPGVGGSVGYWREANARRAKLEVLLGLEAADLLREQELESWLAVRGWLRQRVPAHIAETDDPLEALQRLRAHLAGLLENLRLSEKALRGDSSDVANSIATQIKKADHQVKKLNLELAKVRFGNIVAVQVRARRIETMQKILADLRSEGSQGLLFGPRPEVAMQELMERHTGGRTTGDKVLDYREYLDLQVEVQRLGNPKWEHANPNKMSTGEAIGVGAAVMMVVLTAWEDANRLLGRGASSGSLRLLLLDEANRLSPDSLSVLFDLCKNLELQMLIAAPEVDDAEGNTTYRLVRTVDEGGREIVHVTGRRVA